KWVRGRGIGCGANAGAHPYCGEAGGAFRRFIDGNDERGTPMTWPIKLLAHEAVEPLERIGAQLFRRGGLLILGITCLAVSVVFFTIALYGFLRTVTEPEIASLSVGGIYFFAEVTFLVLCRN